MAEGVQYLDGPRLQRCLVAGLQQLIGEREHLNRINVFPVPDGDTGNNLAHTAHAARLAITEQQANGVGELLVRMADGALDGAQGNSGTLLAQFFQGLADQLEKFKRIRTWELADAFSSAAIYTRTALENPEEGTIITVVDATAAAGQAHRKCDNFAELLPKLRDAAAKALAETTDQLEVLRKAGVVDAGAAGFLAILEGCVDYLLHGSVYQKPDVELIDDVSVISHDIDDIDLDNRYCTECLVEGTGLDPAALSTTLNAFGNSMVIAGSTRRLRIHIHTNDPEKVFKLVAGFGEVAKTKADDMIGQARALQQQDRDVAIVTDSAADIPDAVMAGLGIHMVPLRVHFGADSYLDKTGISPAEFRAELETNPNTPGTSQPTQGDFRRMYEFLGSHFNEVLSVHLSGGLSGTLQAARTAATRSSVTDRITVLDSRCASAGQGLAAKRAADLVAAGLRGPELNQQLEKDIRNIRSFALVVDLTNGVRSGRVKPAVKHIADWLRLTPVLMMKANGKVGVHGFLPGRFRLVERFARYVTRTMKDSNRWEVAIAHGDNEAMQGQILLTSLKKYLEQVECAWTTELGAALGVHAGMEAVVVAMRPLDKADI
ncbi:MAG: hypothetical protein CL799_12620 [Chromatiales bacterium]|jgi:DegV family protein with EDD domain|nr:hypothetical protein [Chromatiales bacterium]MDP6150529.1 DegV family protein [Gammaproteobacteria bacterium]MDP7093403.1 DegV family protein [Gammaproteobacteria bacterium]MDP7270274.1 DegV family protein [Gammaproteobacteria bacterium]HJP05210.1 DegV family protein [Gammaproteobacteria bacterium]